MKNYFIWVLVFAAQFSSAIELSKSILTDGQLIGISDQQKAELIVASDVYESHGVDVNSSLAITNMGSGPNWYMLSDDSNIHVSNISSKEYFGRWNLGVPNPCEQEGATENCLTPWWTGRWGAEEFLEKEIINRYALGEMGWSQVSDTDDSIMGCMGRNPLRYGDIEGYGSKELAVFLLNGYSLDFIIFSPTSHKNIFTSKLDFNNVIQHEKIFTAGGDNDYLLPYETLPRYQFWSRTGYDSDDAFSMTQGYRGFGKLYVGHFETAQTLDLLVWRKVYKSRLLTDPVKGFEKIRDTFIHYKLINGEYQKQSTPEETIKGWLAAKQLTWQKGYPSKSECPGQEGQLIPEMHDPLLNDPDVLQ